MRKFVKFRWEHIFYFVCIVFKIDDRTTVPLTRRFWPKNLIIDITLLKFSRYPLIYTYLQSARFKRYPY